jgi:hypothetical protein
MMFRHANVRCACPAKRRALSLENVIETTECPCLAAATARDIGLNSAFGASTRPVAAKRRRCRRGSAQSYGVLEAGVSVP